jgi:protease-4
MNDLLKLYLLNTYKTLLIGVTIFAVFYFSFNQYKNWEILKNSQIPPFVDDGVCNIAVIPISGDIGIAATQAGYDQNSLLTSPISPTGDIDRVIHDLEYVKNSTFIKGVILQVDSYGGYGNAGEILLSYLKNYPVPTVSLIRDAGDSMGYWVSLGGEKIFAYPGADVGSIGVNTSFISNVEKDKKDGLKYISIVSGKYKDVGVPDKELSKDDLDYLKQMNDKFFNHFVNTVSEKRNMSEEEVKAIADGRTWTSDEAKNLGLIDYVGDQNDVLKWFENKWGGLTKTEAIPCAQY